MYYTQYCTINTQQHTIFLYSLFTKCSANKPPCSDSMLYIEKWLYHHHQCNWSPTDTLPTEFHRFAACGRKQFPSLWFLNAKPRTLLVHSEIVQPQGVSLGMFYQTNKKVQQKPQALMCYRNDTLLSTIFNVLAEILERGKKRLQEPSEKNRRDAK